MNPYLDITPEISTALRENRPVVALESTIISHGMPYPQNVETALKVEATVRETGAIPATIAIINGRLKAGLSTDEVTQLGKAGHAVAKVSRRDMGYIVANQLMGATTVATTMMIAHMAGIRVFATGGIGGVHRGAAQTFDISADLQELAQTPVAVVCAGAKSILDLGLTLEYLETHGVPVIGYKTKQLPAFFTQGSPFEVDYQLDSADAIAQAMLAQHAMQLKSGMVIANPIPTEFAMPAAMIDTAIEQALSEADAQQIHGKQATPFLLARVCELTGGDSLASNIQLVLNNARLAADIATAYCHHATTA
ncbi:pseudouridine-5'-phosphate glycosidase [Formosimonas limnophila]|uniref:Pseudouridine-5'-phosphate glycosidase n=1 Tax=Formosimonas limnophila TaxID=1384487 RepID=A0A8J3CLZ8_9BURK|nr:pseudouridine-5'-phosphate glycosidase [Formosimonas limnophila]GHA76077.1 pseudouridine-5'-phosphate glycosidase [Formosimonas limnophila]